MNMWYWLRITHHSNEEDILDLGPFNSFEKAAAKMAERYQLGLALDNDWHRILMETHDQNR